MFTHICLGYQSNFPTIIPPWRWLFPSFCAKMYVTSSMENWPPAILKRYKNKFEAHTFSHQTVKCQHNIFFCALNDTWSNLQGRRHVWGHGVLLNNIWSLLIFARNVKPIQIWPYSKQGGRVDYAQHISTLTQSLNSQYFSK